jgi:hypothetical protein
MPNIEWDFFRKKVQGGLPHGQFLSGRATIIGAGPPNYFAFSSSQAISGDAGELVYLIGLNQSLTMAQGLQVQRFFEIGSDRHYFISGRAAPTINMSRILYHGPNLLRALYAYYSSDYKGVKIDSLLKRYKNAMPPGVNAHSVATSPGDQNFFINLVSDLFSQPVGLLLILRDQNELTYGIAYAENCYVDQYSLGTDASSIIMSENVNIQCERIVPLPSKTISLVQVIDEELVSKYADGGNINVVTG